MTDKITITITRGCDAHGAGGSVVDNASAVLGSMPDGTPIVDALVAAFADTYGIHEVDDKPVSGYRNMSYRCREYMTGIVAAFAAKQAAATAAQQATAAVDFAMNSVTVIEN